MRCTLKNTHPLPADPCSFHIHSRHTKMVAVMRRPRARAPDLRTLALCMLVGVGPSHSYSREGVHSHSPLLLAPAPSPFTKAAQSALGHGAEAGWALAESIPTGVTLNRSTSISTTDAVLKIITRATVSIEMAVMYWSLLPESCGAGTNCTRTTCPDCAGFTSEELESMGAANGRAVYSAITDAASRGVVIRILQSSGFASEHQHGVANQESAQLAAKFPRQVFVETLNMSVWYGEGIQHAKFIIADRVSSCSSCSSCVLGY